MDRKKTIAVFLVIAFALAMAPVTPAQAAQNTVRANTAEELRNAIASNTRIILSGNTYAFASGLRISEMENLSIVGTNGTRIVTASSAAVLSISFCKDIDISNVFLGHDVTSGDSGVIQVDFSENVIFENCEISGTGFRGFAALYSTMAMSKCVIRDCTEYIGYVDNSRIEFNNCVIKNNGFGNHPSSDASGLFILDDLFSTFVTFNDCEFLDNGNLFFKNENNFRYGEGFYSSGLTRVNNGSFEGNRWQSSAQTSEIIVIVDGKTIEFDVPPMIIYDRILVPLRAIFETIGASVDWDGDTLTVAATKDDTEVILTIGSVSPTINDEEVTIDQPGIVVNERTLAPLRFVAEAFGGTVVWDGAKKTAYITT